ncbi:hypothetical protein BGZ98_008058 [Dissophora globulifera]|nr:hypothetical protein BGZ98_008058 [Dissophora globulifera]
MVLWTARNGDRVRLSKRTLICGSLLLIIMFYYLALPSDPSTRSEDVETDLNDLTATGTIVSTGSGGGAKTSTSSSQRKNNAGKGGGDNGNMRVKPWLGNEDNVKNSEDDTEECSINGNDSGSCSTTSKIDSVQEQDDEQGDEKENGAEEEEKEEEEERERAEESAEEAIAEAEELVEEAAEQLEEAIAQKVRSKGKGGNKKVTKGKKAMKGKNANDYEEGGVRREDWLGQAGPVETMDDEE